MWNPLFETMDREELVGIQLRRFRAQVRYAKDRSPFYRRKLDAAGVDPESIRSMDDVREIPTTSKDELRGAQRGDPFPYGDLLAVDPAAVTEYHQTSGTTGDPVRQADTWADWEWWGDCWATVLWAAGIRPDDRVFFPFSYNVFVAFWAGHYACERIGAEVVPGGNLSSAQRVRTMDELDVTAFMSTPTYALRLTEVAEEEGIDPAGTAVERIVCAGEPGASVPATKDRLEAVWDARLFDHAGATEAGAWGYSCEGDSLGLHFNEAQFLIEVLDEDGRPAEIGERGELVITPLCRTGQPYVRFELHDLIELGGPGSCDCGRTSRFATGGVLGRTDELTKVNGVLLSPTAIEDAVRGHPDTGDEYHVRIGTHGEKDIDELTVSAEVAPTTDRDPDEIRSALREDLKQATGLTCSIDLLPYGTLERPELKANRVTDTRSNDG